MTALSDAILTLPAWIALLLVFALPALEASAFVGFVFPGEIAVILGGVIASEGELPLAAVFVGRFTAALRVLVPGLCGIARMPYRTFLTWNVVGGVLWACGAATLGFVAGKGYRRIEHQISYVGYAVLGLIAVLLLVLLLRRRRSAGGTAVGSGDRVEETREPGP